MKNIINSNAREPDTPNYKKLIHATVTKSLILEPGNNMAMEYAAMQKQHPYSCPAALRIL
uniref:Uncharacterized protein n=1 Tax=Arundo donax TaxID=35708 RepID=A0A0A9E430_ARUDO